ncbi:MAG: TRAP transporter substrate-binding protein DctP [Geminicoccaceae bacterium]|nr:TRAP transporter substrate-binding protein DctP [Geminicoccaceae bacterium]MCX8099685.1 TRAP transporter substrate-binding protein DctP [Geminicoccaceae bacterium]MDW8371507.1 TRAP transporter substrate-binding protein DctP [Geminicoccaceae bacterium]
MSETRVVVQERDADGAKTRRRFLKAGTMLAAGGAATIAMPNVSRAQTAVLKMQGAWAATDILNDMAMEYVDRVNKMSGNRLKIEYLLAGAVVKPFSIMDAVHEGVLDAGHHVTVYWYGKHKAASLFGTGPYLGWNATQGLAWIHKGGGKQLYNELVNDILKLNVVGFFATPMPTQPLGWFKKPIRSVNDLKGLKYRTVGLAADLFQKMGMSVAQLPGGEILPAMERGVIDAFEFNNPTSDKRFGAHDVAKNYMMGSYHQATEYFEIIFNKTKFDALPAEHKAILEHAAEAASTANTATALNQYSQDFFELQEKHGVKVFRTPQDILDAQMKAWDEVLADLLKDPFFKKVVDSQKAWVKRVVAYELFNAADQRLAYEHHFGKLAL